MDTLTLSQFQRLFSQASLRPEDAPIDSALLQGIEPGGSLSADSALDVYRTGHVVRLTEALGETFEAVWWVAGDTAFFTLAKEFLLKNPSSSYNLSDFGENFPKFLQGTQPFPDLPLLPDLARFEWLFKSVFHSPQHHSLTATQIQQSGLSGDVTFTFGPSVHLFQSEYSVYEVWKLRESSQDSLPTEVWDTPQWLLCYKHQHQVYVKHLTSCEYHMLGSLISGATIQETLDLTMEKFPDLTEHHVANCFSLLQQTGIITAVALRAIKSSPPL